jgi:hypothetical protein
MRFALGSLLLALCAKRFAFGELPAGPRLNELN